MAITWSTNKKKNEYNNTVPTAITTQPKKTTTLAEPIAVNPYGTTRGVYGSYSVGTIPVSNSKYDKLAENTLAKYAANVKDTDPYAKQLNSALNNVTNKKDYTGKWDNNINKYLGLMEQDYDPNSDANYIAYKNQYLAGGQKAMQDTLAQAAALTGGYGSSYGQSAAQQTYGEYAAALANKIPELAQAAYEMNQSKLNTYLGLDERDYGRYRDDVSDDYNILNAILGVSDTMYGRRQDVRNNLYNLATAYGNLGDRDYTRMQNEYSMWDNAVNSLTGGSGGSGGSGRSGSSSKNKDNNYGDEYIVNNYSERNGTVDVPTLGKISITPTGKDQMSQLERLIKEGKVVETITADGGHVYSPADTYTYDKYGNVVKNKSDRVRYRGQQ